MEPGDGAGAFIEYETGGNYHVTTSCDVAQNGECFWDIIVLPLDDASVSNVTPLDLEALRGAFGASQERKAELEPEAIA